MVVHGLPVDYGASLLVIESRDSAEWSDESHIKLQNTRCWEGRCETRSSNDCRNWDAVPELSGLNQSFRNTPVCTVFLLYGEGRLKNISFEGDLKTSAQCWPRRARSCAGKPPQRRKGYIIEVLTIHTAPRTVVKLLPMLAILNPFEPKTDWDCEKVSVDSMKMAYFLGHGEVYKRFSVDSGGCYRVCMG